MDSDEDTRRSLRGWVAPFGDPGITDRSHLPRAFRSVPRPSSPLSAKASTKCPSLRLILPKDAAAHRSKTPARQPSHAKTLPRTANPPQDIPQETPRGRHPRSHHNSLFTLQSTEQGSGISNQSPEPMRPPIRNPRKHTTCEPAGAQRRRPVEVIGIEPTTSCLQSRRSPG